jgi:isoleucyl-tRNA synthetase
MALMERHGADAIRWYFLAGGSPWVDRRVSNEALDEVVRQFLLTLWNVYAFYVTYANVDGFDPSGHDVPLADRPPLDRWVLSQLAGTVREARERLDRFDATGAGRRIARFVDDLSNWYVRRARRRFWSERTAGGSADKAAAYLTLNECLVTVAGLLAPYTPFVTEEMWSNLAAGRDGAADSVHLSDFPEANPSAVDTALDEAMQAARDIVSLGRTVRTETKTRVRQPLSRAVVHYAGDHAALEPLLPLVAEELNVKDIEFAESAHELASWRARPNYRVLGPRLGPRVKLVADALARDDGTLAAQLAMGKSAMLPVDNRESVTLGPGDVDLQQEVRAGWGVAAEGGLTVALDLDVTEPLRREGLAREFVRLIQDARKAAGLDVSDRIELGIRAPGELRAAIESYGGYVRAETLAVSLVESVDDAEYEARAEIERQPVVVSLRRAHGH